MLTSVSETPDLLCVQKRRASEPREGGQEPAHSFQTLGREGAGMVSRGEEMTLEPGPQPHVEKRSKQRGESKGPGGDLAKCRDGHMRPMHGSHYHSGKEGKKRSFPRNEADNRTTPAQQEETTISTLHLETQTTANP